MHPSWGSPPPSGGEAAVVEGKATPCSHSAAECQKLDLFVGAKPAMASRKDLQSERSCAQPNFPAPCSLLALPCPIPMGPDAQGQPCTFSSPRAYLNLPQNKTTSSTGKQPPRSLQSS